MFFKQTGNELMKLEKYSMSEVQQLHEILQSEAFMEEHFFNMINFLGRILHSIPDKMYMEMIKLTHVFTSELLELGNLNSIHEKDEIGYPHLVIVSINLNLAYKLEQLGVYGEAHQALLKAKDPWVIPFDSTTNHGDLYLSRSFEVDQYLIQIYQEAIRQLFVSRAALDFRLSKIMGNVNNEAQGAFTIYKRFTYIKNAKQHDLLFYINYLELLNPISPEAQEIVELLTDCYSHEENHNNRFLIASCLAVYLKSIEWTQKATREVNTMFWSDLFHMKILELCHSENIDRNELIQLFQEFSMNIKALFPDRTLVELAKQKYSFIINQILVTLIEKGEYNLLLSLLYNWNSLDHKTQRFKSIDEKNIFILIPNLLFAKGPIFLIKYLDEILLIAVESKLSLDQIMELKSKIEASWYTLIDNDQTLEFNEETFRARQQLSYSMEYIKAIEDFIDIENIYLKLEELPTAVDFEYIESSWTNTPIISVLANKTKHNFSVSVGKQHYPVPTKLNNVLIWFDPAEDLNISTFELNGLLTIFEKYGSTVEVVSGSECTKEGFLEKYHNSKFDLIWVISHGIFDSNNPPYSNLIISKTEKVTAWELQKWIPQMDKTRYLVLNACYSGCANVRNNSMGFLGIAHSATNENQIVLGQLWFVDSLAAGSLGILTLNSLVRGESIQASLKKASLIMLNGNHSIVTALRTIDSNMDIIERIERTSIQLEIPFHSMSGVVYK